MDANLFVRIKSYITEHKRNKRWRIIVTVLAVVVSLTTAYILGTPAHTMTSETYCGHEEHIEHCEECYEKQMVLICEIDEDENHTHTDACYEEKEILVCNKEIHEHTLQCFSNPKADVENEKIWKESINSAKFSNNWGENIVSVAVTQLGYSESAENFLASDDGQIKGYNRYGAFCGDDYCDWGISFCQFCLKYAGIPGECFENAMRSDEWVEKLRENGYFKDEKYNPKVGDVVFLNDDKVKNSAGIIEKINCDKDGKTENLEIIEGNFDDTVARTTVELKDNNIKGYCEVPLNPEQTFDISTKLQNGTVVTVSGDASYLPCSSDELTLTVKHIKNSDADKFIDRALTKLNSKYSNHRYWLFDINLTQTDPKTKKKTDIDSVKNMKLSFSEINMDNSVKSMEILSVDEEKSVAQVLDTESEDTNAISTQTDDFSEYVLALMATGETNITSISGNLSSGSYCLTRDITISSTVNFSNKNITINLNGHKITCSSNPAFRVQGGNVTFYDSTTPTETVTRTSGTEFGKTATYNNGTLTYYVTETQVTDDETGATQETLVKHTVTKGGMIVGNKNGRAFEVTNGGKLNLNTGCFVCNFKNDNGGAIYLNANNSTLNLNGGVIAANSSNNGGAVYMDGYTTANITSGAISGNTATGDGGGGIYAKRETWDNAGNVYATINLTGGYITNNYSSNGDYWAGGGGIQLEHRAKVVMSGGYVTSNKAAGGGGGIKTRQDWGGGESGRVEMTGGFITANNCIGAEGGGLNINAGGSMYMEAGYITNNMAGTGINDDTFQHWGGGGMFCSENSSSIVILNSLVTNNAAGGFGGGVAGCSTGRIKTATDSGAGIFDNEALGEHTSGGESTKNEDHYYAAENEAFMSHGYEDYFCALASNVSGGMLGGGAAKWEGTSDGVPVSTDSPDDVIVGGSVTGLTSHATDEDKNKAKTAARSYFNGNESPTHGGGILANGYLVMGNVERFEVYSRLQLEGLRKKLTTETGAEITQEPGSFAFVVVDEYGEEYARGTNAADGSITLDRRLSFTSAGTFTYYLYEIPVDNGGLLCDTTKYKIEVTVQEQVNGDKVPWTDISTYYYHFTNVKVTDMSTNTVLYNNNPGNDDAHAISISPLGSKIFTNRLLTSYKETGTTPPNMYVSVSKSWTTTTGRPSSISVSLYKNGVSQETVTLNSRNNWKYTWSGLEPDATYTVAENAVNGFVPDYSYAYTYDTSVIESDNNNGALIYRLSNGYYTLINNDSQLVAGGQYIISSSDGKYLLAITQAHEDAFLSGDDKASATRDDSRMRYKNENIPDNCVFICRNLNRDGYQYRYLENQGVNSFPLVQISSSGKALKGTNSNWYSSPFRISNGQLQGQLCPDSWQSGNQWRYVIWDGSSFDTATSISKITYEQISAAHKNYTITNTPETQAEYTLVIRKCEKGNANRVLAGAVFEIRNGNTPLKFTKVSDGCYRYSQNGNLTQLTTSTKGTIRIIGMKSGTYTVTEISPPDGYIKAADKTVTLDANTPDRTLEVQIEDEKFVYVMPETGGMGVTLFYTLGSGLILCAMMYGIWRRFKRRKEVY